MTSLQPLKCFYLILILSNQAWAEDKVIQMVTDINYPPYSYVEDGKSTGIYVDIVMQASRKISGYKIKITPLPWKRGLFEVESGRVPIIIAAYKRPIKRPYLAYSDPMLLESVAIFCHKRVTLQARDKFPDDFKNLRVGVHNGFLMGDEVSKAEADGIIFLEKYSGSTSIFRHMLNNRLDCYINDRLAILHELKNLPKPLKDTREKIIEVLKIRFDHTYLGTSLNTERFPELNAFITQFNSELNRMKEDGRIDRVLKKYKK